MRLKFNTEQAKQKMDLFCIALKDKPMTLRSIESSMGIKKNGLYKYMVELKRTNRIHICDYIQLLDSLGNKMRYCKASVFKLGEGEDLKRKSRVKKSHEVEDNDIQVIHVKAISRPFPRNTDPLMHALFGMI
jgi:hypothetical protein